MITAAQHIPRLLDFICDCSFEVVLDAQLDAERHAGDQVRVRVNIVLN